MNLSQSLFLPAFFVLLVSIGSIPCLAEEGEVEDLRKEVKELRIKTRYLEEDNESLRGTIRLFDQHSGTASKIPKAPEKPQRKLQEIEIRFDPKGRFEIDGDPGHIDSIRTKIESIFGEDKVPHVVLDVDAQCPYKSVMDVMNVITGIGIKSVTFKESLEQKPKEP
jgi:biopolymer transport protein ExbD